MRAAWTLLLGALIALTCRIARAQDGTPHQDDTPPSGQAVPSGASGAVLVAPKPGEPPPPAPTITLPVLTHFESAAYPKEARDAGLESSVVLILDIDAKGTVTKAAVAAPVGHGFDEAAALAAQKFVFDPATRDRVPIAARIRYQYNFTLSPPVPAAPPVHVPQRTLEGRVAATGTDAPVAEAIVTVRGPDGAEHAVHTAADGSWSLLDLPPGRYHVVVSAGGFRSQTADEDIVPGHATQIVFRLWAETSDDEVTVKGTRPPREVTRITLDQREMNRIPGTNGDALRSLQNLPGVARPPGLAGLLIVRGSAPQDTQIFVDGTPIPIVYHFGGLSSVVPTEMLDRIDFYPGNFSTQYGRAMGGVVDVGIRDPKHDKIHAFAQADLIDVRAMVEGPIGNTGWDFALAGRRSWIDVWLKPVLEQAGAGVSTAPVYYDYQALVEKRFSKSSSFRLLFFGSDDQLAILIKGVDASDPSLGGGISTQTGFWRLQAQYKNKFSADTELKITPAFGHDYVNFDLSQNFLHVDQYPLSLRSELTQRIQKGITFNFGLDWLYMPYDVSVRFPPLPKAGQPPGGPFLSVPAVETNASGAIMMPAFYTEFELTPWTGGRIVPGVRLDYASNARGWDLAPRVIARQDVTTGPHRTTIKGGVGIFFQPPQPQETDPVFGQPGLHSNRAIQYDVGVEHEFTRQLEASLEGFYKQLDNLVSNGYYNEGKGNVYGLETLIRYKPDAHFFGWVAYTLSRSTLEDPPDFIQRLAHYDQTHILTILGSYRLGRGWEFGARFRLVSGSLYTPSTYGFYDENSSSYLPLSQYPPFGQRLPMFHQLDLRADKSWKFKSWSLGVYLDVQNVYNYGNVEGVVYNYNATAQTYASGLPFLPSLGIRGEL